MKSAEEIVAEAPVSQVYGLKMAFCCSGCAWWTHDWNVPGKDAKGRLLCGWCGCFLHQLPLEALIQTTREVNPQNFEAFIRSNAANANTGVPTEGDVR